MQKKQLYVLQITEVIKEEKLEVMFNEIKDYEEEMQACQLALNAM